MVEVAEALRKRAYTDKQRDKELKAAEQIAKRRRQEQGEFTQEEFERVFTHRNDAWWSEHNGPLTLTKLAATPKGELDMRYMVELEKVQREAARKNKPSTASAAKPAQSVQAQEENPYTIEAHLKRNPNQLKKYLTYAQEMGMSTEGITL